MMTNPIITPVLEAGDQRTHNSHAGGGATTDMSVIIAPRKLHGYIDRADSEEIVGWVWDPSSPEERVRLVVSENEAVLATTLADIFRPGLEEAGVGDGHHVFRIKVPSIDLSEGLHRLTLKCTKTGAEVPGSPVSIQISPSPKLHPSSAQRTTLDSKSAEPVKGSKFPSLRTLLERIASHEPQKLAPAPSRDEVSSSEQDTSLLLAKKNSEIATAKAVAAKRNADLAAITLYLRAIEDQRQKEATQFELLNKDVDDLRRGQAELKDRFRSVSNQKERLAFEQSVAAKRSRANIDVRGHERVLLIDKCRDDCPIDELRRLAIKADLFNPQWYVTKYGLGDLPEELAFRHYVERGAALGYNPSKLFDGLAYKKVNPDTVKREPNPLIHYIKYGIFERRDIESTGRKLNIKIVMMQKNEVDLIYPWVAYHGTRFGFENLYIVDNGSDNEARARLDHVESFGVNVSFEHRSRDDYVNKGRIVSDIIKVLDREDPADFYFPLDCDEFLGVDLGVGGYSFQVNEIEESLIAYRESTTSLTIAAYLDNHPALHGYFRKSANQRKSFFAKSTCVALDRGFNNAKTKVSGAPKKTPIVYVHYHFKPFNLLQAHARQRLEAFLDNFSEAALRQYIEDRRTGFHSARHLLIDEKTYLTQFRNGDFHEVKEFSDAFAELQMPLPFS